LPLSAQAEELLWRFHETVERAQAPGNAMETVRPFASKAAEQAARIAGVLTLWADLRAREVSPQMMACGVALAGFHLSEAKRLAEAGAVTAQTAQAETLRLWLAKTWKGDLITPREILRFGPNSLREAAIIRPLIAILAKAGWVILQDVGTFYDGATRSELYRIERAPNAV
jgi:Protein of unknown function (DUF3987)